MAGKTREILEIVAAFALAWLGYQLLAAATGTPLPVVSVVSDSMYHTGGFEEWWSGKKDFYVMNGIMEREFLDFPFRNGLSRGDLLLAVNGTPRIGDIIIYNRNSISIVHRLVEISADSYVTKGDNNAGKDIPIPKNQIQGRVVFAVPLLGYPRYILFEIFRI